MIVQLFVLFIEFLIYVFIKKATEVAFFTDLKSSSYIAGLSTAKDFLSSRR